MSMFPYNSESDEYYYPPSKKNITSFREDEKYQCMSPYGPVSNANCPADFPYCNCNSRLFTELGLKPGSVELTDQQLANLRNTTKECDLIQSKLGYSWFGIDYSEPHSSYNCICFNSGSGTTNDYKSISPLTNSWKKYIEIKKEEGDTDSEDAGKIVRYTNTTSASNDENLLFFNYDQRKIFGAGSAFPLPVSEIPNPGRDKVCPGPIIGPNFKYYKEYSKTNATFWNTPPRTPLLRRAQTALMAAQRVKILVHGNINITPGTLVLIDYFNFGGRWMVYRVERTFTAQRHSMYLYLMRDGTL